MQTDRQTLRESIKCSWETETVCTDLGIGIGRLMRNKEIDCLVYVARGKWYGDGGWNDGCDDMLTVMGYKVN